LRIEPRPVTSLAQMVGMVVDSFRPAALAKNLTVETALEAGAGVVNGDLERLQQVVWNLLSNAIRFTPPGGRIQLRYARCGDHVELVVRDSGQGIAPESLPHLFERYWQGRSGERRSQGLGLGLAIAHRIIELHGGNIAASSDGEGHGATFTVTLPLYSIDPDQTPTIDHGTSTADLEATALSTARMLDAATSELEAASSTALLHELPMKSDDRNTPGALRILLVEDHDGVAKACRRLLTSHGHFVVCVPSLAAATTVAERATFDVAICDLSLPDGSGLELLPRLRSRFARLGASGQLPAIAISGSVYDEDVARSLEAGFAAHLAKPFDEENLMKAVRQVTQMLDSKLLE
jgi:CheY-like chemotaxis protein